MERGFDTSFAGGEGAEEVTFNAMFSGVSLQSLLTDNTLLPFYGDCPFEDVNSTPTTTSFPLSFFSEDFPALNFKKDDSENNKKLKLPKSEPFFYKEFGTESTQSLPFNFLTNSSTSHDLKCSSAFPHLPLLQSLEHSQAQTQDEAQLFPSVSVSPSKGLRVDSTTTNSQTLESIVQSCYRYHVPNLNLNPPMVFSSQPAVMPQSKLARRRRQKLSEKTQSLRKLMPWDTKMDMATMLEEAHKYVKFLQAQLKALQTMPSSSSSSSFSGFTPAQSLYSSVFGGLGRLTRNQILQVLVNSPVAQTLLYSQGCCVFSAEQMALLAERKVFFQHQQQNAMFDHSSTPSSMGFLLP